MAVVLSKLVAVIFPLVCPGCGQPAEPVCDACAAGLRSAPLAGPPAGIDAWFAPLAYEGVARELVARAKYRGAHAVDMWLADRMVEGLSPPLPTAVTSVPTTRARRRARGFDHAALLAEQVARRIHRPRLRLLHRDAGPPQTGLAAAARRQGPVIHARGSAPSDVLVVDDVATTGTSLTAAAQALRAAGATRVLAVTAARTAPPA